MAIHYSATGWVKKINWNGGTDNVYLYKQNGITTASGTLSYQQAVGGTTATFYSGDYYLYNGSITFHTYRTNVIITSYNIQPTLADFATCHASVSNGDIVVSFSLGSNSPGVLVKGSISVTCLYTDNTVWARPMPRTITIDTAAWSTFSVNRTYCVDPLGALYSTLASNASYSNVNYSLTSSAAIWGTNVFYGDKITCSGTRNTGYYIRNTGLSLDTEIDTTTLSQIDYTIVTGNTYPVTLTSSNVNGAYMSTSSNATSGGGSGTYYTYNNTVYAFAKINKSYDTSVGTIYVASSGWTSITSDSSYYYYRTGSITVSPSSYTYGASGGSLTVTGTVNYQGRLSWTFPYLGSSYASTSSSASYGISSGTYINLGTSSAAKTYYIYLTPNAKYAPTYSGALTVVTSPTSFSSYPKFRYTGQVNATEISYAFGYKAMIYIRVYINAHQASFSLTYRQPGASSNTTVSVTGSSGTYKYYVVESGSSYSWNATAESGWTVSPASGSGTASSDTTISPTYTESTVCGSPCSLDTSTCVDCMLNTSSCSTIVSMCTTIASKCTSAARGKG